MDFKVTYLDAGLTSTYLDGEVGSGSATTTNGAAPPPSSNKITKRYKTHLRDFLSSCRGKRKAAQAAAAAASAAAAAAQADAAAYAAAAAQATADPPPPSIASYASAMYSQAANPYAADYLQQQQQNLTAAAAAASSPYQSIYSPVENRYFAPEYLASYRSLTTYYPEYAASSYISNSYFDSASRPAAGAPAAAPPPLYDGSRYFDDKAECKYPFDSSGGGTKEAGRKKSDKKQQSDKVKCEPTPASYDYAATGAANANASNQW